MRACELLELLEELCEHDPDMEVTLPTNPATPWRPPCPI